MKNTFDSDLTASLKILADGGLILYPTDTVWGIGCDATNESAVSKVYALKKRADEKALIVLVADEHAILQHTAAADLSVFDYLQSSDRPTTVIYTGAIGLATNLINHDGSIAIRICHDPFCRHLLKRFKKPVVSTSANISGQPTPLLFSEIDKNIIDGVDFVVQHRQDETQPAQSSRIISWQNGKVHVIRE